MTQCNKSRGNVACVKFTIVVFHLDIRVSAVVVVKKNRFAPELNEKEVVKLLENATPGSIKKATKYGMKIFQGKNLKTLF